MAIYRIKVNKDAPQPQPPAADYWREIKLEYAQDLDFAEFEQLNQLPDDEAEEPRRRRPVLRFFSIFFVVLALVCTVLWLFPTRLANLEHQDLSFLAQSQQLFSENEWDHLRDAVVSVECGEIGGTGFNIREDGLIITNHHVVESGEVIVVQFAGIFSRRFVATEYWQVPGTDLAIVDINAKDKPYLTLAEADAFAGEDVFSIGNPLGFKRIASTGKVLQVLEVEGEPVFMLSGAIYSGASGSPVFNQAQEVVGIIYARLLDDEGLGLAIPVSALQNYLREQGL